MRALAAALLLVCLALTGADHVRAQDVARAPAPFKVGERLVFDINYGFLKAGVAVMQVKDIVPCDSGECYEITSEARSTRPFSLVYEVRDLVSSWMSVSDLSSRRFEKNTKEGNYTEHETVVFDQARHFAIYSDSTRVEIPPLVEDVLSSLYYLRTKCLEVGASVLIENHSNKKNYPLEVRILRTERVSVPAGEFDCFVVEPILKSSGLFEHQGNLTVYVTCDERVMPVKMTSKIILGSIGAVLSEYRTGD